MGSKPSDKSGMATLDSRMFEIIHEYILGASHDGSDLKEPHLRSSLANSYKFVIFAFCLLLGVGVVANTLVCFRILKNKMYKDATQSFILNNAISDIVKCLCVLPVSVYVLLIQNWVLGELMCSFLPMIQDFPIHVTTLTFTLMAWDRLRFLRKPDQPRLPAFVCCFGTWLTSMCLVLPYPLYIMYVDIGLYVVELNGVGLCIYNLVDNMEEYMRWIFLTMYVVPMCSISYMFIRSSQELRNRERSSAGSSLHMSADSIYGHRLLQRDLKFGSSINSRSGSDKSHGSHSSEGNGNCHRRASILNISQEKYSQRCLLFMVAAYGVCMCPIMVLRLVRSSLDETHENSDFIDIIYTAFVWIAFVPVCVTPVVHTVWKFSCSSKDGFRYSFHSDGEKKQHFPDEVLSTGLSDSLQKNYDKKQSNNRGRSLLIDEI